MTDGQNAAVAQRARIGTEVRGVVTEFDDAGGLGLVEADEVGGVLFHCTAITDGSRSIPAGSRVRALLVAGHRGLVEAGRVERLEG